MPKKDLKEKISAFRKAGVGSIHVLSDFDRTLTKSYVDGERVPSLISILRDEDYLTDDYPKKAHQLYNKYHPIEIDPDLSLEKKKEAMDKWWREHFELLIESGLSREDIKRATDSSRIQFRDGALDFIDQFHEFNIPFVIISSSGLGGQMIEDLLEKEGRNYSNVKVISNTFTWNEEGKAVGVKEPIIHVMNKDETMLEEFPFYNEIKERPNVILLGDNVEDINMVEGFDYDNLLSVGFLNEEVKENLDRCQKNFDLVITEDKSFKRVNKLMSEIGLKKDREPRREIKGPKETDNRKG